MAFQLQSARKSGSSTQRIGHIALAVDKFDKETNAVKGHDITTGEAMTIRMASKDEFAALYVNRDRFDTEDKRKTEAARQTRKQPSATSMEEKVSEGAVMQMQNVMIDNKGDYVARWANAVITDSSNQAAMSAMIEVNVPRNDEVDNPRRNANIVQVNEAFVPNTDNLSQIDNMLANNRDGGMDFAFEAKTGVTVAVSTGENTEGFRLMTGWDKEEGKAIEGLEANVTRQPYDFREANAQTILAASAGISFDDLKSPVQADGYDRDYMQGLYEAVKDKAVDVSVAPTIQGPLMPFVRDRVIESELKQEEGKGAAKLSNRGYFEAHIGLQQGDLKPDSNERYMTGIREVAATGFLRPTNDKQHTPVWSGEIAARIADVAATKQQAVEAAKAKTNDQGKDRSADMGQPTM